MSRRLLFPLVVAALCLVALPPSVSERPPALPGPSAGSASAPAAATPVPMRFGPVVSINWRPPTSEQLIDQALAAGAINAETALLYKVYVGFGDARLPSQYKGDDSQVIDSHALDGIVAQWDTLSASAQGILLPYLRPPIYVGSWYYLRKHPAAQAETPTVRMLVPPSPICKDVDAAQWESSKSNSYPVTVWWDKTILADVDVAANVIAAIDGAIWPKLTGLMGTPLSDAACDCAGDPGRLDIYLIHGITSNTPPLTPPGCKKTPAYIELRADANNAVVAHEFMHALQWTFNTQADCMYPGKYAWLSEATAEWAMNYVYPGDAGPHATALDYFQDPKLSLDLKNGTHEYDAWLFFYYLQQTQGSQAIRNVWDNTAKSGNTGGVKAVDDAAFNGFQTAWPQFVRWNWNRPPVDFWVPLGLPTGATGTDVNVNLTGPENAIEVGPAKLRHLAATYTYLHFTDPNVRSVMFFNGLSYKVSIKAIAPDGSLGYAADPVTADQKKGAYVGALIKIGGVWRVENWTNRDVVTFCRDKTTERLEELVLIYGNSAYDPDGYELTAQGDPPTLFVSNMGCWRWEGRSTAKASGSGLGCTATWDDHADNLIWENTTGIIYPKAQYQLIQGNLNWNLTITAPCCGPVGSGVVDESFASLPGGATLTTWNGIANGPSDRGILGDGADSRLVTTSDSCNGTPGSFPIFAQKWYYMGPTPSAIGADGIADGSHTELDLIHWTWHLEPKRQ